MVYQINLSVHRLVQVLEMLVYKVGDAPSLLKGRKMVPSKLNKAEEYQLLSQKI